MDHPSANQTYHLILADIAMAAAIRTHDCGWGPTEATGAYVPGSIRDAWFARARDETLRQRVSAMASAGAASLRGLAPDQIARAAETYGVPLAAEDAERIADHFSSRRDAVMTYRR